MDDVNNDKIIVSNKVSNAKVIITSLVTKMIEKVYIFYSASTNKYTDKIF